MAKQKIPQPYGTCVVLATECNDYVRFLYQPFRSPYGPETYGASETSNPALSMLLNYGKYYRVWPFAHVEHNRLYASIALFRPYVKPLCRLFQSNDYGGSWNEIADFYSMDRRNTTTGQPFVTRDGIVLIPVWSVGFYTHGTLWFAIYRSSDSGLSWQKTYEDSEGTYGKHFFQSSDGNLYIGVGLGGGGSEGRVSPTPGRSYLLRSEDMGKTWRRILKVDYPTALYSGAVLNDKTVLVAAREKKSLFLSENGGETWKEVLMGNTTRSVSYIEELHKTVVTSNSALFFSEDSLNWTQLRVPIKGLTLRYPTWFEGKLYMSSVGWHCYVISTDLNKWYFDLDVTRVTRSNLGARMAVLSDYLFVGDEANGTLVRAKLPFDSNISVNLRQVFRGNINYLAALAKYVRARMIN